MHKITLNNVLNLFIPPLDEHRNRDRVSKSVGQDNGDQVLWSEIFLSFALLLLMFLYETSHEFKGLCHAF